MRKDDSNFFEEQARLAEVEAKATPLENVRRRALSSANVWRERADTERGIERERERRARERPRLDS
jgi:hypothetical protein